MNERAIQKLREAVALSPNNIPLRLHLGETLLGATMYAQAEQEFRAALTVAPDDVSLKLGLARAFHLQGKNSAALVIVEDLLRSPKANAEVYVLHARLLVAAGEIERAVRQYRKALDADPGAADPTLAQTLGVTPRRTEDEVVDGRIRASNEGQAPEPGISVERPAVNFQHVGGMEKVKDEIRMKIIHPLNQPELYKAYGKAIGGGILMFGPPGCGKTQLARATAGEVKAGFMAVGINDVLEMWIGQSERNLHQIFEQARAHTPCVLFFDEVDALGASRADLRHSAGRQVINQFLSELDGVGSSNDGVLVLAATNAPWHLDSAFRRPGRFDRIIFVPPPDFPARAEILRIMLKGKPTKDIDYDHLAKKTDQFSGADLKAVVDVAIERKLTEAMKAGTPQPLTTRDLGDAAASIRPSTKEWFATARNYALYANQGGAYDDILKYLKLT